jgi:drug/metabolite transporter (DMT)-like permease
MTLVGGCIWMFLALVFLNIPLQWEKIDSKQFLYLGYLSIAATLITSYLYQKGTVILGPKKVMAYTYLNPASIALLLVLFGSSIINLWMSLGILISSFSTLILLKGK